MGVEKFEHLIAWQKARELTRAIYRVTREDQFSKDFGLSGQIQRAAVSSCPMLRRIVADGIPADKVDADLISSYMYTRDLPDPDLIVRTSGEMRASNFLAWQGTYSEYYFTPKYWPEFDKEELR